MRSVADAAPQVTTINIDTSTSAPAYDVLLGTRLEAAAGPRPGLANPARGGRASASRPGVLGRGRGGGGGAASRGSAMAYQCSRCPKRFATQSNLRRHYLNLHGPDRGPFLCPFCGKVTKNKISLKSHIYAYHKLHSSAAGAQQPAQAQQWSDDSADHPD